MKSLLNNIITYYNKLINSEDIRYFINNTLMLTVGIILTSSYILIDNITHDIKSRNRTIDVLNNTYNGYIDKDIFCNSINCEYIGSLDSDIIIKADKLDIIYKTTSLTSVGDVYIIDKLYYGLIYKNDVYYINITDDIMHIIYPTIVIMLIGMIIIFRIINRTLKDKNIASIDIIKNNESINKYETLLGLVANVNHDVATPLNVINSVFEDYKYTNDKFINYLDRYDDELINSEESCDYNTIKEKLMENIITSKENVELGAAAVRQIYDKLHSMSDGNDKLEVTNESVYELIEISVKLLNKLSVVDIDTCIINPIFKKLKIDESIGMPNMLFVSMVINHLKNAMEAKANRIDITLVNDCINIVDNGRGIDPLIADSIFNSDFSTKDATDTLRGNGLYINKLLLNGKYGGDITLVNSIPNIATVFCLKIKLKRIEDG